MKKEKQAVKAIAASTVKAIASGIRNFFDNDKVQNFLRIARKILFFLLVSLVIGSALILMFISEDEPIFCVAKVIAIITMFAVLLAFLLGIILFIFFLCEEFIS